MKVKAENIVILQLLEVHLTGKKVVNADAFWNGLRHEKLKVMIDDEAAMLQLYKVS